MNFHQERAQTSVRPYSLRRGRIESDVSGFLRPFRSRPLPSQSIFAKKSLVPDLPKTRKTAFLRALSSSARACAHRSSAPSLSARHSTIWTSHKTSPILLFLPRYLLLPPRIPKRLLVGPLMKLTHIMSSFFEPYCSETAKTFGKSQPWISSGKRSISGILLNPPSECNFVICNLRISASLRSRSSKITENYITKSVIFCNFWERISSFRAPLVISPIGC